MSPDSGRRFSPTSARTLRGRHHLILPVGAALARAVPRVPLLTQAGPQRRVLAEMTADDAAARRHGRDELARALVILARAGVQIDALAAGGPAAIARMNRPLTSPGRTRAGMLATAGLLLPAAVTFLALALLACGAAAHA